MIDFSFSEPDFVIVLFCARERRNPSCGGLFHYSGSSESKEYENAPVHTSSVGIY
jgi:hypothetical protein